MWRLTLKQALAHRFRLALTWLAVVLGVAFVSGSLVLTDTSQRLFDDQFRTAAAGVDLTVRTAVAFDAAMGVEVERDPLPADLATAIAATPGVDKVRAVTSGRAPLLVDGAAGGAQRARPARRPGPRRRSPRYTLRAGHAPHARRRGRPGRGHRPPRSAWRSATPSPSQADHQPRRCGSSAWPASATTTAYAEQHRGAHRPGRRAGRCSASATGSARSEVDRRGRRRRARPASAACATHARRRVRRDVSSQDVAARQRRRRAAASSAYLRVVLLALAARRRCWSARFLIANTFAIVVTQRTRELALLRAAGATGRQVLGSVLGEALLVGVTGAAGRHRRSASAPRYGLRGLLAGRRAGTARRPLTVDRLARCSSPSPSGSLVTTAGRRSARPAAPPASRRCEAMRASDPATDRPAGADGSRPAGPLLAARRARTLVAGALASATCAGVARGAPPCCWPPWSCSGRSLARLAGPAVGRPLDCLGVPGRLARRVRRRAPRAGPRPP